MNIFLGVLVEGFQEVHSSKKNLNFNFNTYFKLFKINLIAFLAIIKRGSLSTIILRKRSTVKEIEVNMKDL